MIVYDDDTIREFVSEMLDAELQPGRGIGVLDRDGRLIAGVLFHDWWPRSGVVEITAVAINPRWLTRGTIKTIASYVFGFAQMMIARTSAENSRARSLWRRLGGHEVIVPRLWGRHEDGALLTLTSEQWAKNRLSLKGLT